MPEAWTLRPGEGPSSLRRQPRPSPPLAPGQIRVSMRAVSLNARDLMVAHGQSPMPVSDELVPASDGAGVVEEIGSGVTHVAVGDRVVSTFNPAHQSGRFEPRMAASALGELADGVLAEEVVIDALAAVKLPDALSFEQAACLPCTGVTAWNALFGTGPLLPGQVALATGTGNVSLMAIQLARAAGARVGVTSSSTAKLDRAAALGAHFGVNYRARTDWGAAVKEASGTGAHVVLENAGPPSIAESVRATARGGRVVQIGWKGLEGPPIDVLDMALGDISLTTVMVGSRRMLEDLVQAIALHRIEVPIQDTFGFADAVAAFEAQAAGPFGKVVITVAPGDRS
ncbi:MAG: NAD(P)-dependent alcohol dehydrogenase [Myxococcota bacterium]